MYRIGIDLGGTKIEGILMESTGEGATRELHRERIPTLASEGYDAIVGRVLGLIRKLSAMSPGPTTLGIGTPGAISPKTGLLRNSNSVCLNGKPLREDLEKAWGRPLALQNDANCFAMAEALHGAGRGHALVFGVIMGTGCGGGLVVDGKVWGGPMAIGGEWGHMQLDPQGPDCYCGQKGCVETFISGGGLERRYFEKHGVKRSLADITAAARAGEEGARLFMEGFYRRFARAMANLINILDPSVVVLGGGVSNIDGIYTEGVPLVASHAFTDHFTTPIVKNQLGDSAGVLGAALIGI